MKFWKMNGAGNDFVLINNIEEKIPEEKFPELAKTLCTRRLSIGADGMMIVEKPLKGGDLRMIFFNSDGSLGEMCGNGARCICRYAYETGLSKGERQVIETTAGIVTGERLSERIFRIRLNDPSLIETEHPLCADGREYPASYVMLGDPGIPHACVPYTDLKNAEENALRELGRTMRFDRSFPKGANVNFYEILPDGEIYEKTFERGVEDFTYACGTGTGSVGASLAVMAAAKAKNSAGAADSSAAKAGAKRTVDGNDIYSYTIHVAGGTLYVDVVMEEEKGGVPGVKDLFLAGPTNIVAIGEVKDEELPEM